ncbi:helix-turn-helix domain-containing protein [Gordonia sp. GN26]
MTTSPLVPIRELAAVLGCTRRHALDLVREGTVAGKRVGSRWYVHTDALEKLTTVDS